jgi:hypothetical protein
MKGMVQHARRGAAGRDGFVLPVVIFALVIMSTVAVVALSTSMDERRASRGLRKGGEAFYAAEAGVSAVRATWNDTTASFGGLVQALVPGDSLVAGGGWQTLSNGAKYRATVMRLDTAGQRIYLLSVQGRDRAQQGESSVRMVLTQAPGGPRKLGACCEAAATVRGVVEIGSVKIDGVDVSPPGWDANGTCNGIPKDAVRGATVKNDADIAWQGGTINGDPPVIVDPAMSDNTFQNFDTLSYAELKAGADHSIGTAGVNKIYNWGGDPKTDMTKFGPSVVGGQCNTADPLNFGSNNPSSPCYNYWPIITTNGDIGLRGGGYAQGIFVLGTTAGKAHQLDMEGGSSFVIAGIILGNGCIEVEAGKIYGAVFTDGWYGNTKRCTGDPPLAVSDGGSVQYSSCVVQRALAGAGIGQSSGGKGVVKIDRAFEQVLR